MQYCGQIKNEEKVLKDTLKILEECKKELKIKKDIKLVIQEKIKTPSIYGIVHTKILLNSKNLNFSLDELRLIFMHELNHYKLDHHMIYMILGVLKRIYWFNPLIYIADYFIKQDLEYSIDEKIIYSEKDEKEYAKTLLKVLAVNSNIESFIPNICGGKIEIERRIRQMKQIKIDTKTSMLLVTTLIVLLSFITISLASDKVDAKEIRIEKIEAKEDEIIIEPLKGGEITARFGEREHAVTGEKILHTGVDVASSETDEIVAIASGKVIYAGYNSSKGNNIKIEHKDGSISSYAHGSKILVSEGEEVVAGETIMIVGSTGMATGPHLHFELQNKSGEYIDVNQIYEK